MTTTTEAAASSSSLPKYVIPPVVVVCAREKRTWGIGMDGQIPWNCPQDVRNFALLTKQGGTKEKPNLLLCGSKTYESIKKKIVLDDGTRVLMVLCSKERGVILIGGPRRVHSFDEVFAEAQAERYNALFICGGQQVYTPFMTTFRGLVRAVVLTEIVLTGTTPAFDTFFPFDMEKAWAATQMTGVGEGMTTKGIKTGANFNIVTWEYVQPENRYLKNLAHILRAGEEKGNKDSISLTPAVPSTTFQSGWGDEPVPI